MTSLYWIRALVASTWRQFHKKYMISISWIYLEITYLKYLRAEANELIRHGTRPICLKLKKQCVLRIIINFGLHTKYVKYKWFWHSGFDSTLYSTYPIKCPVHCGYEHTQRVYAAAGCEEQEVGKGGVVEGSHTVIDPGTVMVHLHHTSKETHTR